MADEDSTIKKSRERKVDEESEKTVWEGKYDDEGKTFKASEDEEDDD